jgi:MFS family permease
MRIWEMGPAVSWEERRTLVLVNLASIMERADEALLPAVYREVGAALHATPTGLGTLTLYRSIVQAACYPLAAYAASRHNRAHVIAVGAFLWAAATFLVAISETFLQVSPAAQPPLVLHRYNGQLTLVQSIR